MAIPAAADSNTVKWFRVNTPTEGNPGDWVLAKGSDIQHLTASADGTLYCYANPAGTSHTLFKSSDGGRKWSYTGKVKDTIVDIVTIPGDASTLYYATASDVYQSTDAGSSFTSLTANPGDAGSGNIEITSLTVTRLDSRYYRRLEYAWFCL
jgi:hypothetical protein